MDWYPPTQLGFPHTGSLETSHGLDESLLVLTDAGNEANVPLVAEAENREELITDNESVPETEDPLPPIREPVVDTELQRGDGLASSALGEDVEPVPNSRPKSEIKPVFHLSSDKHGKPTAINNSTQRNNHSNFLSIGIQIVTLTIVIIRFSDTKTCCLI